MAVDAHGNAHFVTSERDTVTETPVWSSSFPAWFYLVKHSASTDSFQTIATGLPHATEIVFDLQGNLWIMTASTLYKWSDGAGQEILSAGRDAHFKAMAVDSSNTIWVSMLPGGIYAIAGDGAISHHPLMSPDWWSYGAADIHVSESGSIWLALLEGAVLRLEGSTWHRYELPIEQTSKPSASCLTTDWTGQLWVGAASRDAAVSLLRFDGREWHMGRPGNPDGTDIHAADIRRLVADGEKLWVLVSIPTAAGEAWDVVRTYDGSRWAEVPGLQEATVIHDIEVDRVHHAVWVGTVEGDDHRTALHRYSYHPPR